MRSAATIIAFAMILSPAKAADSMVTAMNLGSVIASEQPCGLTFDQAAIERYIEKNVKADDIGFPSSLHLMTEGQGAQIGDMSPTSLRAHCTQIRRIAKSYKFIAD